MRLSVLGNYEGSMSVSSNVRMNLARARPLIFPFPLAGLRRFDIEDHALEPARPFPIRGGGALDECFSLRRILEALRARGDGGVRDAPFLAFADALHGVNEPAQLFDGVIDLDENPARPIERAAETVSEE